MNVITLKSTVSLRHDLRTMKVDDAIVIGDEMSGDYFGVELIARRIWQLLDHPGTVAELCDALVKEYDVDRATCERDVLEFLNDSTRQGLIDTTE